MNKLKKCTRCGEAKPRTEYYREKLSKDGLRSRCKDCMKWYGRTRRIENRAEVLAREAAWREANRDSVRERQLKWEQDNREHVRQLQRKWREENHDHLREYRRNRYQEQPRYQEKAHQDAHKRRARIRSLPSETVDRSEIFDRDGWVCQLCGEGIPIVVMWPHPLSASLDHVVPLSDPECPGHLKSNVQASHLVCNLIKSDRSEL